jgi:hypothetical protein
MAYHHRFVIFWEVFMAVRTLHLHKMSDSHHRRQYNVWQGPTLFGLILAFVTRRRRVAAGILPVR